MNRTVLSIQSKQKDQPSGFNPRDFKRMVGLSWHFKKYLLAGIGLTVVFAGFHAVSLAGAFPIFKTLLEEEGLRGWVDRTVAQNRLGLDFAPPDGSPLLRVVRVHKRAASTAPGIVADDLIADAQGKPAEAWLAELSHIATGTRVPVTVRRDGEPTPIEVVPGHPEGKLQVLRWVAGFIPDAANTPDGKLRTLGFVLGVVLVMVVIANVFRYWGEILIAQAVLRGLLLLRYQLYERVLHLPMSFFAGRSTADVVSRFVQDMQEIQRGQIALFGKFLREPIRAGAFLAFAFFLDWRLTLTAVVVVPLTIAVFWLVGRSVKKANHKLLLGYGQMIDALTTSLHNLRVVKAYTAEELEQQRLTRLDERMFKQQLKLAKMQALINPVVETLAVFAGSFVTLWLAGRVVSHHLEVAEFVTLGVVLSMLFDPLRKMTDVYVKVQRSTAGAERIFRVLDEPIEHDDNIELVDLAPLERAIEFDGVTFTYPGAEVPAVRDVSLTVRKGETIAIVGPNGSGKTTLVSLLPRFFDPDSGSIRYDGIDIRRARLKSLRRQIGLVTQEAIVFGGTPVENIAYGLAGAPQPSPNIDGKASPSVDPGDKTRYAPFTGHAGSGNGAWLAQAEEAARRAFADEFIRNIPGGYEAKLGERGTTLSGGQRQRMAIARAICRDAPILIFDEATSQIDTESEAKIQQALREFARGRTTIIIAHRLSTIQFADRIVVMDAGRIIDSGTHTELFGRCTLYKSLCETQLLGETTGTLKISQTGSIL